MSLDTLLDGRVHYEQPEAGHRTGIEPVLLAAAVAARPGARVLEGGSGAGAALLCLAHRVPGLVGLGLEREAALAQLAQANATANGFAGLRFLAADLLTTRPAETFDHAMANPPWHAPAGTASPDSVREGARRAAPGLFADWARALAAPLRHKGTLTLIVAAGQMTACLEAMRQAGCGGLTILPLWPKQGRAAKLVLLRGTKGTRSPSQMLPGLTIHEPDGTYTPTALAILRHGEAVKW